MCDRTKELTERERERERGGLGIEEEAEELIEGGEGGGYRCRLRVLVVIDAGLSER